MAIEIIMPTVSNSMTEGILARWVKKEGETVCKGDVVAEIETDKAIVDLEAEGDGVIGKLFVSDGATIQVGTPIGIILGRDEPLPARAGATRAPAGPAEGSAPNGAEGSVASVFAQGSSGGPQARILVSPVARNLALLHDIDLSQVQGSGPNGRIVKRDIEAAVASPLAAQAQPAAQRAQLPVEHGTRPAAPAPGAQVEFDEIPHSSIRRVIAQRLSESKQQVPHFYLSIDCQVDALLALRQQINAALPESKVSVNDFVIKAVAAALKKVPAANAAWTSKTVRRYRSVDISVAVATPNGLLTPVVHNAHGKSLGSIAAEVKALAERARSGKLLPNEYQGGGFSISNLGMYGIREFAAIINPPQACILAVGAGQQRPVIRDGGVVVATVMSCTLSVDHRAVDGAVGAEFLAAFKSLIESPLALLV